MSSYNVGNSEHLTDDILAQYLDGELPSKQAAKAREHLETCWSCRGRANEFEQGVLSFLQYRKVVVRELGGPPSNFHGFQAGMAKQRDQILARKAVAETWAARRVEELLLCWNVLKHHAVLSRAALAVAAFVVAAWVLTPSLPQVSAKEALNRSAQSEEKMLRSYTSPVVHQEILVHAHGKQAHWDIWRTPKGNKVRATWNDAEGISQEIKGMYRANNLDTRQPLSPSNFSAWRESLAQKQDHVTVDARQHLVQISTDAVQSSAGQIQRVTFTLRQDNWHPVDETIYIHAAEGLPTEYRLEETAYTVLSMDMVPAAVLLSSDEDGSGAGVVVPPVRATSERVELPTETRLLDSEVKLTRTLHEIGADVREAPEVQRHDTEISLSAWTDSPERKQQILAVTKKLPYIVAEVRDASTSGALGAASRVSLPLLRNSYPTEPPLARAVWEYYGSAEEANLRLAEMSDDEQAALAAAAALSRLSKEYSEAKWQLLSAQEQATLNGVVSDHVAALRRSLGAYLGIASPLVDEMLSRENIPTEAAVKAGSCTSWRTEAPRLAVDLPHIQISLQRLFLESHAETLVQDTSPQSLLTESTRLRSRIQVELGQLCTP